MLVYVLLFNARTENEGIHTLKVENRNVVLMFENEDDATRFGLMLEAQDFPPVTVESFEMEDIEEFCASADYGCKLVPEGTLTMPPEQTVDQLDWDPDADPEDVSPAARPDTAPEAAPGAAPGAAQTSSAEDFSQAELDELRRRLEKLL